MRLLCLLAGLLGIANVCAVVISNTTPRVDSTGTIMDIHDGNTFRGADGTYYYYGASYGLCEEPSGANGCANISVGSCGFRLDHNVSLYTSKDMGNWTFQGHVFQMTSFSEPGILYCPKLLYNPKTELYVLWFNWLEAARGFSVSSYAVATSKVPQGPFTVVTQNVTTLAYTDVGDFGLFQDEDGQAYIIYTAHIQGYIVTHQMSIERLTSDYQATEGKAATSGFFGASGVEAPVLFRRANTYYAGSAVTTYTSSSPLGPYKSSSVLSAAIPAQQTNVLQYHNAQGQPGYLWQGDRWQSAPDHIKGHDFSYWGEMSFSTSGEALPLVWQASFNLTVS